MISNIYTPSRRSIVKGMAASVTGMIAAPSVLRASAEDLKIGVVIPLTGPLGPTLTGVEHVIGRISEPLSKGIQIGGQNRTVTVITKDSQSSPNRAAEVTSELILKDGVDIIITCMAPDTVNPVADQCELNEVPCVSSLLPWQTFYYGRGATDKVGFNWTWHLFWGVDQVIDVFEDMWKRIPTNKVVGALWPTTGDGLAWADAERGFPPVLAKRGYKISDPGRFKPLSDDFSQIIAQFKADNVEILTGVVFPPDWTTFWTQAAQQGFKPKAASAGNCLVFPASVEALGDIGNNHSFDLFWHPDFPFTSTITGQTARAFADDYIAATGRQWIQTVGSVHMLFEAAVECLKQSGGASRAAIRDALAGLKMQTIGGKIDCTAGPVKNVALTPLTGGQWRKASSGKFPYEPVIVSNIVSPDVPLTGEFLPL
jgi:branched-chain amino acid transport system substrate-binding protein